MKWRLQKRQERFTELDRLKSEFVSTVSHELRTPLTTIKALTRLLMRDGVDETKKREYLETISVECDHQIDLVLNLLDLSRIEGGVLRVTPERVDVREVISSVVKAETRSAEKRSHDLGFEGSLEVPPVCADPKEIRRVLSNIVENAIKYTPDESLLLEVSETLRAEGYEVQTARRGSEAMIRVAESLPDLIISDIRMPGMDGYALVRNLRASPRTRLVPIIFLTAKDETADRIAGFRTGVDAYLTNLSNPKS
jgi:signal transduction histidine kinase